MSPTEPRLTERSPAPGDLGRLGAWSARHAKAVFVGWLLLVFALSGPLPDIPFSHG